VNKILKSWLTLTSVLIIGGASLLSCSLVQQYSDQGGMGIHLARLPSESYVWYAKWSPNGEEIALISQKPGELRGITAIYLYDLKSEEVIQISTDAERSSTASRFYADQFDWAPDATTLAIAGGPAGKPEQDGVWLMDLESYEMEYLTKGTSLSWSPVGDRMAIIDTHAYSSTITILNIHDQEEHAIREFQHEGSITFLDVDWSPRGDNLVISVPGENAEGYRWDRLYLVKVDGSYFGAILEDSPWRLYSPVWLANGKWLAFVADASEGGTVSVAPVTGECIFAWIPGIKNADRVDVSPDGRKALVVSSGRLYIVDLEEAAGSHLLPDQLSCP
jgi:Tol biopolymer transport system component